MGRAQRFGAILLLDTDGDLALGGALRDSTDIHAGVGHRLGEDRTSTGSEGHTLADDRDDGMVLLDRDPRK